MFKRHFKQYLCAVLTNEINCTQNKNLKKGQYHYVKQMTKAELIRPIRLRKIVDRYKLE